MTLLRHEARVAIADAIDAQTSAQVTLDLSWPDARAEQVWVGGATGDLDYALFAAASQPHDDRFEVQVLMRSGAPGQNATQASAAVHALMNAVIEAIRGGTLSALAVSSAQGSASVVSAILSRCDGPMVEPGDEGHIGYAVLVVAVHARGVYI